MHFYHFGYYDHDSHSDRAFMHEKKYTKAQLESFFTKATISVFNKKCVEEYSEFIKETIPDAETFLSFWEELKSAHEKDTEEYVSDLFHFIQKNRHTFKYGDKDAPNTPNDAFDKYFQIVPYDKAYYMEKTKHLVYMSEYISDMICFIYEVLEKDYGFIPVKFETDFYVNNINFYSCGWDTQPFDKKFASRVRRETNKQLKDLSEHFKKILPKETKGVKIYLCHKYPKTAS